MDNVNMVMKTTKRCRMSCKKQNHFLLKAVFMLVFLPAFAFGAQLRVANMFADHMVLQRDLAVPVWGWAEPDAEVTVTFGGQVKPGKADKSGRWMVRLDPLKASAESRDMVIQCPAKKETRTIRDVVVGEVWLCSGQSNMDMEVQPDMKKAAQNDPLLRHGMTHRMRCEEPIEDLTSPVQWTTCKTGELHGWSGVAYSAGVKLRRELGVPIGLINSSMGGTGILMWMPRKAIDANPEYKAVSDFINSRDRKRPEGIKALRDTFQSMRAAIDANEKALETGARFVELPRILSLDTAKWGQCPTVSYNAQIHPLIPYAIRGLFWYQGEQDGGGQPGNPLRDRYTTLLKMLVDSWRQEWGQGDFPVVVVQLPNCFGKPDPKKPEGEYWWSTIREAQEKAVKAITNLSLVVTIDVGDTDVHPRNKFDVGMRVAQAALARVYGKDVIAGGPVYKGYKIEGDRVRIFFDQCGKGLMVGVKKGYDAPVEDPQGKLKYFVIAGKDKRWHWADAVIDGETVLVSSKDVPAPEAVRFAQFQNPNEFNFYNRDGFPVAPFRTDDWTEGLKTPDESIGVWYQGALR